jgi:hypothetical protein
MELTSVSDSTVTNKFGSLESVGDANNVAGELESLKYYILSIQICESIQISGTSFDNPTGCLMLYQNDVTSNSQYDNFGHAAALADTQNYLDLLNSEDRGKLSAAVGLAAADARSYNYGLVNWMKPIKVKVRVPLSDGSSLYSRTTEESGGNVMARDALTNSPAEESVVVLNNGGNWIRFQSPLVISSSNVMNGAEYKLTLAFNPDGIVHGKKQVSNFALKDSAQNGIDVPMIDLAPIPHKADDNVIRETYYINFPQQNYAAAGVLRLELYYVSSDAAKTIYGATTTRIYTNSSAETELPMIQKVSFITSNQGLVNFLNWENTAFIEGLRRFTTPGQAGNCRLLLGFHYGNDLLNTTYTLHSVRTVA